MTHLQGKKFRNGILLCIFFGLVFSMISKDIIGNSSINIIGQDSNMNTPQYAAGVENELYISNIDREWTFNENGRIEILDTMTFQNNRTVPVTIVNILITDEQLEHLVFYQAYGSSEDDLLSTTILNEKDNALNVIQVTLQEPMNAYSEQVILFNTQYHEYYDRYVGSEYYIIQDYQIPIVPYDVEEFHLEVGIPSTSTDSSCIGDITMNEDTADTTYSADYTAGSGIIDSYNESQFQLSFVNGYLKILEFSSIERTITINPLGYIRVVEEHTLISYSYTDQYYYEFYAPAYMASNITASDELGEIYQVVRTGEIDEVNNREKWIFQFNGVYNDGNNIYSNRYSLQYENKLNYKFVYFLDTNNYTSSSIGKNNLNLDLNTIKFDHIVREMTVKLIILGGSSWDLSGFIPDQEYDVENGIALEKKYQNVVADDIDIIDITYKASKLANLMRGILFSVVFFAIFGIYLGLKSITPDVDKNLERYSDIPIKEIGAFLRSYEEKNVLLIEKQKTDTNLKQKKINKKQYLTTITSYNGRIGALNKEIEPVKADLLSIRGKWITIIETLDFLEAEKESIYESIRYLKKRYKEGKIPSKLAYERLSKDQLKRLDKTQGRIDRNISELHAFMI